MRRPRAGARHRRRGGARCGASPMSGCVGCRQLVAERSLVGDELLLLAPAQEPPLEFEASVLGALAGCQDVEGPSRSGGAGGGLRQPPPWSSRPRSGEGRRSWPRPAIVGSQAATGRFQVQVVNPRGVTFGRGGSNGYRDQPSGRRLPLLASAREVALSTAGRGHPHRDHLGSSGTARRTAGGTTWPTPPCPRRSRRWPAWAVPWSRLSRFAGTRGRAGRTRWPAWRPSIPTWTLRSGSPRRSAGRGPVLTAGPGTRSDPTTSTSLL